MVPCSTALTLVEHRVMRMGTVLDSAESSNPGLTADLLATSVAMLIDSFLLMDARVAKQKRDLSHPGQGHL